MVKRSLGAEDKRGLGQISNLTDPKDQLYELRHAPSVGCRTPNLTVFAYALKLLGVQASEVLMIGGNLEADIEPALALGMKAFQVN